MRRPLVDAERLTRRAGMGAGAMIPDGMPLAQLVLLLRHHCLQPR
jgi:hypothetical protein